MEDRRAHERIDEVETALKRHLDSHHIMEEAINKIADNTSELVDLFRGAKGLRKLLIWIWPFALILASIFAGALAYLKGN